MDKETEEVQKIGKAIKKVVKSDGWGIIRERLNEKIIEMQMIGNVAGATAEEKVANMEARLLAAHLMYEWLEEVEGESSQYQNNKELINSTKGDLYERNPDD